MNLRKFLLALVSVVATNTMLLSGCTDNNQPTNSIREQEVDNAQVMSFVGAWQVNTLVVQGYPPANENLLIQLEPSQGGLVGQIEDLGILELIPGQGDGLRGNVYIFRSSDRAVTIPVTANLEENKEELTLLIRASEVDQNLLSPGLPPDEDITLIAQKDSEYLTPVSPALQAEGKNIVGTLNRVEQVYHLENGNFTDNLQELDLAVNLKNYTVNLNLLDGMGVQTIAIPQQEGLRIYTGGVFFVNNSYKVVVCESAEPSQQEPGTLRLVENEVECPSGFNLVQ